MSGQLFQETSPFTKYFLEQEKNYRSPVFANNFENKELDIDPEQIICKRLNFEVKSPLFAQFSPVPQPTLKKAPVFGVSPVRVLQFDKARTEQRIINSESPVSEFKMDEDLRCPEEFISMDEEEEDDEIPSKFQSPKPNQIQVSNTPQRKHSERAKNMRYIGFMTLKKPPAKFASEQPRRRSTAKRRKPQTDQKPKTIVCNCKKSKCLKLYCDCFAAGAVCGKDCNCNHCHNNDEHTKERESMIKSIVERNPSAFRSKVESKSNSEDEQPDHKPRHFKGCNCKKSNCLKKYCECYQMGVKCSDLCKCEECKNCEHPIKKETRKKVKHSAAKDIY